MAMMPPSRRASMPITYPVDHKHYYSEALRRAG
jgi:hypothetical protein